MANLIYQNPEATVWFVPATATQAEDAAFEVHNLASGAGRQSAQWDRGVGATSAWYEWCAFVQFTTTPVVGETVDIYLKPAGTSASATAHPANDDGTSEGAVSAEDKTKNLDFVGSIVVDEAAANVEMVARGAVYLTARAYQCAFWNSAADALTNDVNENGFFMTPIPDEVQ
jgi:hypothetical protein